MQIDSTRVLAIASTVCINVALITLLVSRGSYRAPDRQDSAHDRLEVAWIEVRRPVHQTGAVNEPERVHPRTRQMVEGRPRLHEPSTDVRVDTPGAVPKDPPPVATVASGDDAWAPADGHVSAGTMGATNHFRRNPLERRNPDAGSRDPILTVTVRDRSFGGWAQAQTRRSLCGDLRRQLTSAGATSSATILATMRRHRC